MQELAEKKIDKLRINWHLNDAVKYSPMPDRNPVCKCGVCGTHYIPLVRHFLHSEKAYLAEAYCSLCMMGEEVRIPDTDIGNKNIVFNNLFPMTPW